MQILSQELWYKRMIAVRSYHVNSEFLEGVRVVDIGFRERLAFVRWLRARGKTALEKDTDLADGLGVGYEWLKKWSKRSDAPPGREQFDILAKSLAPLGVSADWLYSGRGPTPHPELWARWLEAFWDLGVNELDAPPETNEAPPDEERGRNEGQG